MCNKRGKRTGNRLKTSNWYTRTGLARFPTSDYSFCRILRLWKSRASAASVSCHLERSNSHFSRTFLSHSDDYVWSSKQIIAAASSRKVCLYYPFNGFTRALDITDRVCLAFSNSGDYLAIAYRKSALSKNKQDLYVFRIDHKSLLDSENLDTEKVRTPTNYDITALCYARDDEFLMCGTNAGKILVFKCTPPPNSARNPAHKWHFVEVLTTAYHKKSIKKISFSCNFRYMATLDANGRLVIWTGESWTILNCLQQDNARQYKHIEWHPFVEEELILVKSKCPAIYLINVVRKEVVAGYKNWKENMEITSIAFNPVTAQLAVCFYIEGDSYNIWTTKLF